MAVTTTTVKTSRVVDHRFYYAVAAGLILVVFAGFARTYYLKGMFGAPPLPMLVHIHGAVMTLWYALFAVQVRLVATDRVAMHRKLGWAGIFLAGLVAVLGTMVSLGLCQRRLVANPIRRPHHFCSACSCFLSCWSSSSWLQPRCTGVGGRTITSD